MDTKKHTIMAKKKRKLTPEVFARAHKHMLIVNDPALFH